VGREWLIFSGRKLFVLSSPPHFQHPQRYSLKQRDLGCLPAPIRTATHSQRTPLFLAFTIIPCGQKTRYHLDNSIYDPASAPALAGMLPTPSCILNADVSGTGGGGKVSALESHGYSRSFTLGATSSISKRRERCISEWSSGSWVIASRCPKPPTSSWSWRILSAHSWGSPTIQTCSIM
jgi:hypothetical protein